MLRQRCIILSKTVYCLIKYLLTEVCIIEQNFCIALGLYILHTRHCYYCSFHVRFTEVSLAMLGLYSECNKYFTNISSITSTIITSINMLSDDWFRVNEVILNFIKSLIKNILSSVTDKEAHYALVAVFLRRKEYYLFVRF